MIDLHIHTTHSDGTDTTLDILKKAAKLNIEDLSITDHNSVKSYYEIENMNIKKIYEGNIIVGCEFTTSYNGRLIEILGYNFDFKKVNEYLNKYYSEDAINIYANTIYNRFIDKTKKLNLTCSLTNVHNKKFNTEFVERQIYDDLIKYPENISKIGKQLACSYSDFFRLGLTNPNSVFYLNHASLKPKLDDVLNVIHESGGIAFLAHPYQYKFDDLTKTLDALYSNHKIDGIECYHTTFNNLETKNILTYANKNNLLICGGSDYHGTNKTNHNLGNGNNNLKISKNILDNWKHPIA